MKKCLSLLALITLLCGAADFTIPRVIQEAKWSHAVGNDGALRIMVGSNTYEWRSRYSYPNMPADGWLKFPGVPLKITRDGAKTSLAFSGKFFTLRRDIAVNGYRLEIRDTVTNVSGADLAIAHDHDFISQTPVPIRNVLVGGVSKCASPAKPSSPCVNSTVFFVGDKDTLGVLMEDDWARLQADIANADNSCRISNRSFCLPPKGTYTFRYSFYPTASGDYYDFINRIRHDWKQDTYTLKGNMLLATSPHKSVCDISPKNEKEIARLKSFYDWMGVRLIGATSGHWLGNAQIYSIKGARGYNATYGDLETMKKRLARSVETTRAVAKDLQPFAHIQTVYAGPHRPADDEKIPMEDSVIVLKDGSKKCTVRKSKETNEPLGYIYFHYPMVGNSYYDYLCSLVDAAASSGVKSIYFDTFTYAYWEKYGRWTYDRWDGFSCDIDEKTWTIGQKKADLAVICQDALIGLLERIINNGGTAFFNHSICTEKMRDIEARTFSIYETRGGALAKARHLTHPTNLGYFPGYRYMEPWDTPAKLLANVLENLEWGCLTYPYWPVRKPLTGPTIMRHLFPIQVKNIYSGCVEGTDRIITRHTGTYSLGSTERPQVFIFDADGTERQPNPGEAKFSLVNGQAVVHVTVPEQGAAVIREAPSVLDALEREIGD